MNTLGCNSAKNLIFFKKKVATLSLKITVHIILLISEVLGSHVENGRMGE